MHFERNVKYPKTLNTTTMKKTSNCCSLRTTCVGIKKKVVSDKAN